METTTLDCGHAPTRDSGIGTGYATHATTGRTMCYPCADDAQRADLVTAHAAGEVFGAYLTSFNGGGRLGLQLTTWAGGILADVIAHADGGHAFGGVDMWHVTAVDVHGNVWHGKGRGPGMVIGVRPVRTGYVAGRIVRVEFLNSTSWGNPRARVTLDNGRTYQTSDDASVAIGIENTGYREVSHLFQLTRSGRIVRTHRIPQV